MTKRKSLSVKTRFDVFKRDRFACQYCGAHPPDVLLHIDHILALANGGTDEQDNLVTACEACNLGKGARELSTIPESLIDKANRVAEAEKQLAGYTAILEAKRDRIEADCWHVVDALWGTQETTHARFRSIKAFVVRMGVSVVLDAAEISAGASIWSVERRFRYFCAVCWNRITELGL